MGWRHPLPPHAKKVFEGVIFDVWQWEQELYDGSGTIFERVSRPNTVFVLPIVGDKICIVDEEQPDTGPYISIPAGRCEKGEESLVSAQRELKEETGLESNEWELLLQVEPVSKMEWTIYVYIARNCKKTGEQALDGGEIITPRYVTFEEFLALSDNPKFFKGELSNLMQIARFDGTKRDELRAKLFGH